MQGRSFLAAIGILRLRRRKPGAASAQDDNLLDPQNDVGLLPVVELAQGFRVTLFALALSIDLIIHIGRELREAIGAVIAGNNGAYRFPELSPNVDYEIYAQREGKKSDTKTLSQFDDRQKANIILRIK